MDHEIFLSIVPIGHKNAIDIKQLSARAHVPQRTARKIIEEINSSGRIMILNLSDGKGYFIADQKEKSLERLYKSQESKRFMSLKNKLEGMNLYLDAKRDPAAFTAGEMEKNQISIFDIMGT